jgi:hypothetical protein
MLFVCTNCGARIASAPSDKTQTAICGCCGGTANALSESELSALTELCRKPGLLPLEHQSLSEEDWHRPEISVTIAERVLHDGSEEMARVYLVRCCRLMQPELLDGKSEQALEVAERYAKGKANFEELSIARKNAIAAALEIQAVIEKEGGTSPWTDRRYARAWACVNCCDSKARPQFNEEEGCAGGSACVFVQNYVTDALAKDPTSLESRLDIAKKLLWVLHDIYGNRFE